jgi:hypothetical protein
VRVEAGLLACIVIDTISSADRSSADRRAVAGTEADRASAIHPAEERSL